ncbi:hypothetical protein KY290_036216 [Solanum tuberosum]|uniref:Uncharacterized protein n=1 Tax=Solanum tuberosum TaxID=4113 RepID=A0ABQ7TSI5_SOLTU|nr:hypothetical protein KY290_036216 [Solanum tuberosum]
MVISRKEQQGATSALRWADIVDEEEKRVSSPPMHNKLSPAAPILVPRSAKSVMPGKGFDNLQDEDIFEEGEEEDVLDHCFANAIRNADISPSWDGKMSEEFVPRHLPMRLAKQNHMTV